MSQHFISYFITIALLFVLIIHKRWVNWLDTLYLSFPAILLSLRLKNKAIPMAAIIVCLSLGILASCNQYKRGDNMKPLLSVQPQQVFIGDPINIKATGLQSGQIATLIVSGNDRIFGNLWSSQASFRADEKGNIDTSLHAPIEGTYKGIDQAGLFWSMRCIKPCEILHPFPVMPTLTVSISINGQEIETQAIKRLAFFNLEEKELSDPIVGVFFMPKEITKPTPALIILGGSEGRYNKGWAGHIASKTRMPTLALAYFGLKDLPPTLENIPLETIEKAMQWLSEHPLVIKDRFGLVGASRGGELAILAASIFPQIRAVVGYTPSGMIWEGIGSSQSPAWTYKGKPFPYLKFMMTDEQKRLYNEAQKTSTVYMSTPSFLYAFEMQKYRVEEAAIPVEKSKAGFLLIGNPDDGVWPSQDLSQITIDRLKSYNHPYSFELLSYEKGGHMMIPYPYFPTTLRKFYLPTINLWEGLGGTAEGSAKAAEDSWHKVIEFLYRELN